MDENMKDIQVDNTQNDDIVEYEEVQKLPLGAFVGIGLAFGVAAGFSVGNLLINKMFGDVSSNNFAIGMIFCIVIGVIGGLALGFINKSKSKK